MVAEAQAARGAKSRRFVAALALCSMFLVLRGSSQAAPPLARTVSSGQIAAATLKLSSAVAQRKATISLSVVDVGTGEPWALMHPDKAVNPASNIKILTAWAALLQLGAEHRYVTRVLGDVDDKGHAPLLVVHGDGDPDIERRHVYEWAAKLRRAGLRSADGIVVDQSFFDAQYTPPAFAQQPGEWASFRAPVAAVSLGGNAVAIEVRPSVPGKAATVRVHPPGIVKWRGRVRTVSSATKGARPRLSMKLESGQVFAELKGSIPALSDPVVWWKRVEDPRRLVGFALRDALTQLGISVQGDVALGKASKQRLLVHHRSNALSSLLHPMGKKSNNFYAEMIFKRLGKPAGGGAASFKQAATWIDKLVAREGLVAPGLRMTNGSGLFDANRISAASMTRLLVRAYRDPRVRPDLLSQLAIGGVDGTLRRRFTAFRKARSIRAKTGTLAQVSALSGYVMGKRRTLAFSVLIDDARGHAIALRRDIDAFVATLARHVNARPLSSP